MANRLTDMEITSVDLVEAGANQKANIEIVKGKAMTEQFNEEMISQIIEKKLQELLKANEEATETVEETVETVETEVEDVASEDVEKSAVTNAYILKMAEKIDIVKAENAELKKKLEMRDYEEIAKKYEVTGHNPKELAQKLYKAKNTGNEFYDFYVAELDNALAIQEQSGIFKEIGTSRENEQGSLKTVFKGYEDAGISSLEWYEKAASEYPELLEEYDRMYRGE